MGNDMIENAEWNMNKDIKTFGEREIRIINNTKGIKFQIQIEDLHKRFMGKPEYHIIRIIWKDLNGIEIMQEELFEKGLNSYLYGIKSTLSIMKKVIQ